MLLNLKLQTHHSKRVIPKLLCKSTFHIQRTSYGFSKRVPANLDIKPVILHGDLWVRPYFNKCLPSPLLLNNTMPYRAEMLDQIKELDSPLYSTPLHIMAIMKQSKSTNFVCRTGEIMFDHTKVFRLPGYLEGSQTPFSALITNIYRRQNLSRITNLEWIYTSCFII